MKLPLNSDNVKLKILQESKKNGNPNTYHAMHKWWKLSVKKIIKIWYNKNTGKSNKNHCLVLYLVGRRWKWNFLLEKSTSCLNNQPILFYTMLVSFVKIRLWKIIEKLKKDKINLLKNIFSNSTEKFKIDVNYKTS